MPRTRRARPDLTDSWDPVEDEVSDERFSDVSEDEELDDRAVRRGNTRTSTVDFANQQAHERDQRKVKRASVEPELIMPRSPNGAKDNLKPRAKTPHFRMNERSLTSDAGDMDAYRKVRSQTPRFRMNARSNTSDAGQFLRKRSGLVEQDEDDARMSESFADYPLMMWERILKPTLAYFLEVLGHVFHKAKPLLANAILVYLVIGALVLGSGFITSSYHRALSPLCRIPGVTWLWEPSFCPDFKAPEVGAGPAEFDKLVQAQSAFNDVLAASSTGVNLPLDMKRSEAGIRDLKHVVQYSNLPSKNELVYEFDGFVHTARQASQDLSKFNSRIGHAVDKILSTNRWTLTVIDGITSTQSSRGSISKFVSDHLNIFAPFQPVSLSRDILLDQYLRHTSEVEEQISNLITEAQALLNILDNLDGRLDVIAGVATRDGLKAEGNRDELFAYLWTKLGGNRNSVKKLDGQIQLLRDVQQYRSIAWAHVTNTIVKLQAIRDNLEDLRERVAMPETVGTDKVPLEVHIESINLGIQRLEEQRDNSRRLESETYQRQISRAEAGNSKMIGDKEL